MTALSFFNLLQLIGGFILAVGYIPQIIKIIKTKSVKDFSMLYLGGIFTGIVFMEIYAVYMFFVVGTAGAFFLTNTVSTILSGIEFGLVLYYVSKSKKGLK
ncbi:PQ-loop domain-containing transporter [Bacillus sp. NPDC077027]|uniref:PQ-loop domain-containing transporter n=1 Tax=Bacillus sp. NPDC077027 TaxID=3390548 RepID=UPI003D028361